MKNSIIVVLVAFTLVIATTLKVKNNDVFINTCMEKHATTEIIVELIDRPEFSFAPTERCGQEYYLTSEKIYELENPADYMDGLTAISKRCIYVGEAEYSCIAVKLNV